MPIITKKPQAQTEQESEQTVPAQTDEKPEVQTEQVEPQPIPESTESVTEQIPPHPQETKNQTANTNTTSIKENPTMNENTIIHTVSAPVQTSAQITEPVNPIDELTAKIEAMKAALKEMIDEAAAMGRTIREVALTQRQKEREYQQTKRAIERIRVASGAA